MQALQDLADLRASSVQTPRARKLQDASGARVGAGGPLPACHGSPCLARRAILSRRNAALVPLALVVALAGCVGDETRAMTATCERFVANGDASGSDALLRDAQAKLAALDKPANAVTRYIRNLQDPDALAHRAALRECVWRLRSLRR